MSAVLRRLEDDDDRAQAWALSRLAFGREGPVPAVRPGTRVWGLFADGRLLGKASLSSYTQWWGGRPVPMGGVGGVAVHPDARGGGTARTLLLALLEQMRQEGIAVSALFPTAPGIYRSLGWALAGSVDQTLLPTSLLARAAMPSPAPDVRVRSARAADLAALSALWQAYGQATSGLLTRDGPSFPNGLAALLEHDVVALAEQDGRATGYLAYDGGRGSAPPPSSGRPSW